MRIVETIAGGGISNNAKKRHLSDVMNAESNKWKEHYETIYFTNEDFEDRGSMMTQW